jgi:predicted homoserine dehydrogenase-like protein
MPAKRSVASGGLPLGLAHGIRLRRPVAAGTPLSWDDVDVSGGDEEAIAFRRQMERELGSLDGDLR